MAGEASGDGAAAAGWAVGPGGGRPVRLRCAVALRGRGRRLRRWWVGRLRADGVGQHSRGCVGRPARTGSSRWACRRRTRPVWSAGVGCWTRRRCMTRWPVKEPGRRSDRRDETRQWRMRRRCSPRCWAHNHDHARRRERERCRSRAQADFWIPEWYLGLIRCSARMAGFRVTTGSSCGYRVGSALPPAGQPGPPAGGWLPTRLPNRAFGRSTMIAETPKAPEPAGQGPSAVVGDTGIEPVSLPRERYWPHLLIPSF